MLAYPQGTLLQSIAHEQVVDNSQNFFPAQEIVSVPPALEVEKAVALLVDVGEQVGVFLPDCESHDFC
jgi:hypothetical protein